jgi:UDP-glucose 4-epimerase
MECPARLRKLTGNDGEVLSADRPATDWSAALAGVEAVVHLAARVHHPGAEHAAEIYNTINTEGTLQLARSAAATGVRRSSMSAPSSSTARTDGRAPFREDDQLAPRGVYGDQSAAEAGLKGC